MINLFITWLDTIPPTWGVVAGALLVLAGLVVAILFAVVLYRADAYRNCTRPHPISELVGPALHRFSDVLAKLEGKDFTNNRQWELDGDTVILIASEDCHTVYRLRVPTFYFKHGYLCDMVEGMVRSGSYTKTSPQVEEAYDEHFSPSAQRGGPL